MIGRVARGLTRASKLTRLVSEWAARGEWLGSGCSGRSGARDMPGPTPTDWVERAMYLEASIKYRKQAKTEAAEENSRGERGDFLEHFLRIYRLSQRGSPRCAMCNGGIRNQDTGREIGNPQDWENSSEQPGRTKPVRGSYLPSFSKAT